MQAPSTLPHIGRANRQAAADLDPLLLDLREDASHAEWWMENCASRHEVGAAAKYAAALGVMRAYGEILDADATVGATVASDAAPTWRPVSGLAKRDFESAKAQAVRTGVEQGSDPADVTARLDRFASVLDQYHGRRRGWPAVSLTTQQIERLSAQQLDDAVAFASALEASLVLAVDAVAAAPPKTAVPTVLDRAVASPRVG